MQNSVIALTLLYYMVNAVLLLIFRPEGHTTGSLLLVIGSGIIIGAVVYTAVTLVLGLNIRFQQWRYGKKDRYITTTVICSVIIAPTLALMVFSTIDFYTDHGAVAMLFMGGYLGAMDAAVRKVW